MAVFAALLGAATGLGAQSRWREIDLLTGRDGARLAADPGRQLLVLFGGDDGAALRDETWLLQGGVWQRLTVATSPQARRDAGLAFDAARNEIVLFGGRGDGGELGDTWRFDGSVWSNVPLASSPGTRHAHGMCFDPVRNEVVVFGGRRGALWLADTWTWNGTAWQLRTGSAPSPRAGVAFAAAGAAPVLFGGRTSAGAVGGTFVWTNLTWSPLTAPVAPPPRFDAVFVDAGAPGTLLLVGGADDLGVRGDSWRWSSAGWSAVPGAIGMAPRGGAAGAFDPARQRPVVALGRTSDDRRHADTLEFDGVQWQPRAGAAAPPARSAASLTADVTRQRLVLFGGQTSVGAALGDTWEWDGAAWHQRAATGPAPRHLHAASFDDGRGTVVLLGGFDGLQALPDFWEWNGTAWSQLFPQALPPARHSAALCPLPAGGALLFGGLDAAFAPRGDTWRWRNGAWQPVTGAAPSVRHGHAMACDPVRRRVVLFGGRAGIQMLADTWAFDEPGGWLWLQPQTSPPARAYASFAAAEERQRLLLVGGLDAGLQAQGDTWEWDGATWRQRVVPGTPPARLDAMLQHHAASGRTVLFGGSDQTADLGDTHDYAADFPASVATIGAACSQPSGAVTLQNRSGSLPWTGDVFEVQLDGLQPTPGLALVIYGFSDQLWNGQPLPQSLAPFGLPGCTLYMSADDAFAAFHQGTTLRFPFPLPTAGWLRGFTYWNQALVLDASYANPLQATTTNALRCTIGAR